MFDNAVNPGSRLVNNLSVPTEHTFAWPLVPFEQFTVDCTDAVSYSLRITTEATDTVDGTVGIILAWKDIAGNPVSNETFEINKGINNTPLNTSIQGPCRGTSVDVIYVGRVGGIDPVITARFVTSSLLLQTLSIAEESINIPTPGDGILFVGQATVPPGGTSAVFKAQLSTGRTLIKAGNSGIQTDFRFKWGLGASAVGFTLRPPTLGTDLLVEVPTPSKPLVFTIFNGNGVTTGTGFVAIWTNGV